MTSLDGIGASDFISRESMMTGLRDVAGGGEVFPFVRMFYDAPSEYLWEDDAGDVHKIPQGEGGEQGDPMMPLLHASIVLWRPFTGRWGFNTSCLGRHWSRCHNVGAAYAIVQEKLWVHSCIPVHVGKTKVWNRAGIRPLACDVLERIARVQHPHSVVIGHSHCRPRDQGSLYSLGTPILRGETSAEGTRTASFLGQNPVHI